MKPFNFKAPVTSTHDIKLFFAYLMDKEKLNFHPDDPFTDYGDLDTQKLHFTPEQAEERQQLINSCFEFCERVNADIYLIAIEAKTLIDTPFNNPIFKEALLSQTTFTSSEYAYSLEFVDDGRSEIWELDICTTGISEMDGEEEGEEQEPGPVGDTYYYETKEAAEEDINFANWFSDLDFQLI